MAALDSLDVVEMYDRAKGAISCLRKSVRLIATDIITLVDAMRADGILPPDDMEQHAIESALSRIDCRDEIATRQLVDALHRCGFKIVRVEP